MKTDLDTLLIALYVLVDDHVIPTHRRGPVGFAVKFLSQCGKPRCFHLRIGGKFLDG